jgi:hypothetical protein
MRGRRHRRTSRGRRPRCRGPGKSCSLTRPPRRVGDGGKRGTSSSLPQTDAFRAGTFGGFSDLISVSLLLICQFKSAAFACQQRKQKPDRGVSDSLTHAVRLSRFPFLFLFCKVTCADSKDRTQTNKWKH